jgi:CRISPR-associated protein Csh2
VSDHLSQRREFLFLYDIRMGNPNGDPDENRPRRLPDGTFYVTDVRLKRFVRDWLKTQGESILVDRPEDAATNLTGRLQHFLRSKPDFVREDCERYERLTQDLKKGEEKPTGEKQQQGKRRPKGKTTSPGGEADALETAPADLEEGDAGDSTAGGDAETKATEDPKKGQLKIEMGRLVVDIILKSFIDARLFGSSLAFKEWDIDPRPKTLTGAVQINMGEVLHQAHEVDIAGTSIFGSTEEKRAGTFTTFYGLRYGLIGFNGMANEHSARLSRLTDADYELFLQALWKSVASAPTANTRSKMGQVPRLLVDITYKPGSEFQFGCLLNYAKVRSEGKAETAIASPDDYRLDLTLLVKRLQHPCVEQVRCAAHPDLSFDPEPLPWSSMDLDKMPERAAGG